MLPHWCIKPPKIVLGLVYLKKDNTDTSVYQQLFMEIRDRYRDHISVYRWFTGWKFCFHEIAWFIITAEFWAIIKALEEKKKSFYRLTFVYPSFTIYKAGTSLDWDDDTKICLFKLCQKRRYLFVGFLAAILELWVMKGQILLSSALDLPHAKAGVPYNDFKHCINQYIISTWHDDWNGAVANKLRCVKPVLGDWLSFLAGRMILSCVVRASAIRILLIHISWRKILHLSI